MKLLALSLIAASVLSSAKPMEPQTSPPPLPIIPAFVSDTLIAYAQTECAAEGVPWPLFCRLVDHESGWSQEARNINWGPGGQIISTDVGIMQLNSLYHYEFVNAYKNRHSHIENYDLAGNPYDNVQIGIRHLAYLKQATGSWRRSVAAYNGGYYAAMTWKLQPITAQYVDKICPVEGWWIKIKGE